MLELVKNWLVTFPQWNDGTLYVEHTDVTTGNAGLYPTGLQELQRTRDILGNTKVKNRCSFLLRRVTSHGRDNTCHAQWLLQLQSWVQSQSLLGLAPKLGENTRWFAQKGRLTEGTQPGTGVYSLELVAEYEITSN